MSVDWLGAVAGADFARLAQLLLHFAALSLLAVGGAITTVPEMQRYLVHEQGWLDAGTFTASVALAQAAPGPNVLFVAVLGYNVAGLPGVVASMAGTLLPSTTLALAAARWGEQHARSTALRAFTAGMAPVTIGLLLSTCAVLVRPLLPSIGVLALLALTVAAMWRTRLSPLWLLAAGAAVGAAGWV